jgi:hypothetical protein
VLVDVDTVDDLQALRARIEPRNQPVPGDS